MMSLQKRFLSETELEDLYSFLQPYELPNMKLVTGLASASEMELINLRTEETNTQLHLFMMPMSSQVVDSENPKKVEAAGVLYDREMDLAWYVPPEDADEHKVFPELRQAFHEGESYKEREADFKYHFEDGDVIIARYAPSPVQRCDEAYEFTKVESLGGHFPRRWLLETESGESMYLRERSGSIKMYREAGNGELVFHTFVGKEHPGTYLHNDEIFEIVTAVQYFNIVEDYQSEVSEQAKDNYFNR